MTKILDRLRTEEPIVILTPSGAMDTVEVDKLKLFKDRVRKKVDRDKLKELKDSINKYEIIEPIIVDTNNNVIMGNRRAEALKLSGKR